MFILPNIILQLKSALRTNYLFYQSLLYWVRSSDSEQGGTGCQCDVLSENIWFTWSKGKGVDRQMDRT